jgi:hypothetical protein
MRRLAVLAGLALLAAGCGGGGGGASGADIERAAAKTARAGSLEADFRLSGAVITGQGSGVFNTGKNRSGQLSMTIDAGGREFPVETVITGNVLYMRSPALQQVLSGSKEWIKVDLARLAQLSGSALSGLLNASPTPTNALAYLAGSSDVEELGSESVQGVKATHYKVRVDLERAADRARPEVREALRRVIEVGGVKKLPVDVWVDEDGYVRRVRWAEHAARRQAAQVTMDLHDFGAAVSIEPPPRDAVVDLSSLGQGS